MCYIFRAGEGGGGGGVVMGMIKPPLTLVIDL